MNIVFFKQLDILTDAIKELRLQTPKHVFTVEESDRTDFEQKYFCETTFFFNEEPHEKKFTAASYVSPDEAHEDAAVECLRYLTSSKGLEIVDYNYDDYIRMKTNLNLKITKYKEEGEDECERYIMKRVEIKERFKKAHVELDHIRAIMDE
ncbi:hypothetical protein M5689_000995 [Euphorbia peplus]|nr:hypothetical protein M5689_000995 [Euphorbia peplus]